MPYESKHSESLGGWENFNDLSTLEEAQHALRGKSALICPDTCVLLHMVRERKSGAGGVSKLQHLDFWITEMDACRKLLSKKDIGWVIPEQIIRECRKNASVSVDIPETDLIVKGPIIMDDSIRKLNDYANTAIEYITRTATSNRNKILAKSITLVEEDSDIISGAWKLVYNEKFPNTAKEQQMKDSAILIHLHHMVEFLRRKQIFAPVYFWTFDTFGKTSVDGFKFRVHRSRTDMVYVEIREDISQLLKLIERGG